MSYMNRTFCFLFSFVIKKFTAARAYFRLFEISRYSQILFSCFGQSYLPFTTIDVIQTLRNTMARTIHWEYSFFIKSIIHFPIVVWGCFKIIIKFFKSTLNTTRTISQCVWLKFEDYDLRLPPYYFRDHCWTLLLLQQIPIKRICWEILKIYLRLLLHLCGSFCYAFSSAGNSHPGQHQHFHHRKNTISITIV